MVKEHKYGRTVQDIKDNMCMDLSMEMVNLFGMITHNMLEVLNQIK